MDATKEVLLVDCEYVSRTESTNSARTGLFFKKGHLTEEFVGSHFSQPQFPSISLSDSLDLAFLNDEHTFTDVSLTDYYFAVLVLLAQIRHAAVPPRVLIASESCPVLEGTFQFGDIPNL